MRATAPSDVVLAAAPPRRRESEFAGARTAWWEYGPAEEDALETVLLVHGFRGTHHGLQPVVARLPEIRFIAPDLPGFGESARMPREHALAAFADWLVEFVAQVDPAARARVVGHSFGSLVVANALAGLAPRPITLINPIAASPLGDGAGGLMGRLAIAYYAAGARLPEPVGRAILSNRLITRVMSEVMAVSRDRALRAWIHAEHDRHFSDFGDRDSLLEAYRASLSDSVLAHAGEFPARTTIIAGARDVVAPVETQLELVRAMPEATLHVIEGVGHLVHYETPVAAARILRELAEERATAPDAGASTGASSSDAASVGSDDERSGAAA